MKSSADPQTHRISQQLIKYLLIGGIAWIVDFLTFVLSFSELGIVWAQAAARINGALVGFIGHKLFVFEDRRTTQRLLLMQAIKYLILWCVSYGLSTGGILWLMDVMSIHPVVAKFIVETIVIAVNFLAMKRFIFAP